mmetsp:Transcript_58212/g.125865  ORF Transcript_58212/g.125865 Transcript_58212/m.125865 type:complete len:285 (+) Transcript_58212:748-1602(+)
MAALPEKAPAAAEALDGVSACGPFDLGQVNLKASDSDKTYPPGVSALADVHWTFTASKSGESDGPVWCFVSCEIGVAAEKRTLGLLLQRSSKKLLHYTHMSEEGRLLPSAVRCNACGLTLLSETADGLLVFEEVLDVPGQAPCLAAAPSGGILQTLDLGSAVEGVLAKWGCAPEDAAGSAASATLLALLDSREEAPSGRRHELLVGIRLPTTATEVQQSYASRGAESSLIFVRPQASGAEDAAAAAAAAALRIVDVDSLGRSGPSLTETSRRAMLLLSELRRQP